MRPWLRKWAPFVAVLLTTGCSELQIYSPNPRIETPELRGERGVRIQAEAVGTHRFRVTGNAGARPPDAGRPETQGSMGFVPGLHYDPIRPLGLGLEWDTTGQGGAAVVKWQLLGEGVRRARKGNFSLGAYGRAGMGRSSKSGDQKVAFGPGGYAWNGTMSSRYAHTGLSVGYRVEKEILLYGGVAAGWHRIYSRIDQDPARDGSDAGGSYQHTDHGNSRTAGGGILFGWRVVQFFLGGEYTHVRYQRSSPIENAFFRAGIQITPGGSRSE
ncbi:MAG: hypothetical protein A2X36_08090 [Elusimicrobia bacterium GWA2_69_24]|nr:MAG: hypothetical protein A2X36_08090 [Elusimicrobia bacterium GWA2_69_24]HBL18604.1 hypothetical protein [Elusimicrobiota bacterium]